MLHGLKIGRRRVLAMLTAALVIGLLGSIYATLNLGYQYGALNLHRQYFSGLFAWEPFRFAARFIETPTGPYWLGWLWNGVGAAVMALLLWARHHLLWWPLASHRLRGQRHLDSRQRLVQYLSRLAD